MTHLAWDDCCNTRDLGGLPTRGGGHIRPRALIRSDILSRLTPAGQQALVDYGVVTVIDLRWPTEVTAEPSAFGAGGARLHLPVYRNLPLENRSSPFIEQIDNAPSRSAIYCLTLDHCQPEVAAIVGAVADAPTGGVLLHCHAGKDRTGLIIALLLGLVGVPGEAIAADYAASEERLWPLFRRMQSAAADDPARLAALQSKVPTAPPETILDMLQHVRMHYDGVRGYLLAAGLTELELARVEQRLVENEE